MQLPKQLSYNQLQTKAFFSVYKKWEVQPSNGNQYFPGQLVKIFLNALTTGVMDPYLSCLEITVSVKDSDLPVGLLQIDNSAQSFIENFVLTSRNRQIERIIQSGILAAYLNDLGLSQIYAQGRQSQGLGYNNIDNYSSIYTNQIIGPQYCLFTDMSDGNNQKAFTIGGGTFPTIPSKNPNAYQWGNAQIYYGCLDGVYRGHITPINSAWLIGRYQLGYWTKYVTSSQSAGQFTGTQLQANVGYYGYATNMRAQYLANLLANDYVDTTSSLATSEIHLDVAVQNNTFPAKFTGTDYNVYVPQQLPMRWNYDSTGTTTTVNQSVPNQTNLFGFNNLYSPNFAKGVRQPFISPTTPQCKMSNGRILPQKIPVAQRTFKVPLLSAIIGVLIPEDQFVLLPLRALNDMIIQFTIDQFAMFTSGYNDIAEYDNVGMGLMQQRAFNIVRIVYNLHTYQFYDPQIDEYLKVNLTSGIAINTRFWQLGNQYQIENSQSLSNSWPVACNSQALNEIVTLFIPLDYQNLSFCRKHFRISNNITKLQLRINMDYYPSQALMGNAGNPIQLDSTGNNSIFLEQLKLSNNGMFQWHKSRINEYNFAINQRCYDVTNTNTAYDSAMYTDGYNYSWSGASINADTALGMCNIHQNRYVGKAAFSFSFEPYSHSKNLLAGIDCRMAKSFDIIFGTSTENYFPRPQAMYIYTCSSVIVQYNLNGIQVVGK